MVVMVVYGGWYEEVGGDPCFFDLCVWVKLSGAETEAERGPAILFQHFNNNSPAMQQHGQRFSSRGCGCYYTIIHLTFTQCLAAQQWMDVCVVSRPGCVCLFTLGAATALTEPLMRITGP